MGFDFGTTLQKMDILSNTDNTSVISINLFIVLLCACIVIGHLLEGNHWMNESITPLIIGVCTGVVILLISGGKKSRLLIFSEDLFFIYLLPPIIFNAGFQVKKKQFFRNFSTITLFGALGTLISFTVISLGAIVLLRPMDIDLAIGDYLALGAIFAATDSVCTLQVLNQDETPLLYSLVFGEGVVNDATSVVLFNAVQNFDLTHINTTIALDLVGNFLYLFITSTILGVVAGLLSAYVIKKLYFGRHSTDREVAIMMLLAYLSYMLSELFNLSAILTVFFCGIVMSHYTWHNVTENSRITTKHTFATLSFVAEIFIFLYVGMDALDIEKWHFVSNRYAPPSNGRRPPLSLNAASISMATANVSPYQMSISVSGVLLGLVLVGRAAFIFPLSFLSNLTKKSSYEKIDFKKQITIWWAGLMRGAVSMALAYKQFTSLGHTNVRANAIMITSTITVVLFSTVVFGLITKPLVRFLLPSSKPLARMISSEPITPHSVTVPLLGDEQGSLTDLYGQNTTNGQASDAGGVGQNVPRPNSLRMLLTRPTRTVHYYWRKFDNAFMRPVFGGRGFVPFVPGSPTERSLHCFPEELEKAARTLN